VLLMLSVMATIDCISAWVLSYRVPFSLVLSVGDVDIDASSYRGRFSFGYLRHLDSPRSLSGIRFEHSERGESRYVNLRLSGSHFYDFGWISSLNRLHVHDMSVDDPFFKEHNLEPPPTLAPIYVSITRELMVPAWCLTALAVIPLGILLQRAWRDHISRRRRAAGQCLICGYDLRAHAVAERCPECGTRKFSAPR